MQHTTEGVIFTPQQRKANETTAARAATLWMDGYELMHGKHYGIYEVFKPAPSRHSYSVDLLGGTCTCRQFAGGGICKHQEAVRNLVYLGIAPGMDAALIADFWIKEATPLTQDRRNPQPKRR